MKRIIEPGIADAPTIGVTVEARADNDFGTGSVPTFDTGKAARYSVANVGAQGFYTLFLTGIPFYLESYGLGSSMIGLLSQERSFVAAFVQPVVGRISDRTRTPLGRRRPFFLIGIPLTALALMALAFHPPFWIMLGIMTFAAFFLTIAWDPYMALMADIFPPSQRGRVGGFSGLANGIGAIAFLLIAFTLWAQNEFLVFTIVTVMLLVTWGFTFLTVKEPPIPAHETERKKVARPNPVAYLKDLVQYPEAGKYVLAVALFWLGSGGAAPFITLFGMHALGATQSEAFLLPIMFTVSTAVFALPAGFLADRIGKKSVLTAGLLIYGLFALVGSQSQNLLQGVIVLALIGVGNAGLAPIMIPLLTDLVPRRRVGELIGVGSAVFAMAQPAGSVIAGGLVDLGKVMVGQSDAYRWSFIFAGAMIVLGAVALQRVRPELAAEKEEPLPTQLGDQLGRAPQ